MMTYPFLPKPENVEGRMLGRISKEAFESVWDGLPFEEAIRLSDKRMCELSVRYAWDRFKEMLAELEPQRWVAHVPHWAWVGLPLDERSRLGARPFQNVVLVEGVGEPPAILSQWTFSR